MRCDLETFPAPATFDSEICIIGAGIAGLILARQLGQRGKKVHLLEAGGLEQEPRSQTLYAGAILGTHHRGMTEGRYRTFGGSSVGWAAQLLPYPDEVFQPRAAVDHLGWPISAADITRYYPEIHQFMEADTYSFDDNFPAQVGALPCPSTDAVRVRFSKWAPFQNRNLGKTIGKECLSSERITVFLHANAVSLTFHPDGNRVESVIVRNYHGGEFTFTAMHFVIATGTMETSRLLLHSTSLCPAGAGNEHDQVGRYFFDHVACEVGRITDQSYPHFKKHFAPHYLRRTLHTARLEASPALQEKLGILAVMAHFEFEEPEGSGLVIFRRFLHDIQHGRVGRPGGQELSRLPIALLGGLQTFYDLKVRGRRIPSPQARIILRFDLEQKPCAESRITLLPELDALGVPRLALDWRRSEAEAASMHAFAPYLDAFLQSFQIALQWDEGLLHDVAPWRSLGIDCFHPMGGTRMGTDPKTSVVDPNLRVHSLANLFIASCATYPTGGSSNPTFTLMALTLRLADYLTQSV